MHFNLNHACPKWLGLIAMAALGGVAHAQATLPPELLETFTRCDAGFFRQLAQVPQLEQLGPIEREPQFANFKVPDRNDDEHNRLVFSEAVKLGTLSLTRYEDSYRNLGWDGRYWSWGFVVKGSPKQVLQALPEAVRSSMQHTRSGEWVKAERMDLRGDARTWSPIGQEADGKVPDKGTLERALMLSSEGKSGDSLLVCSLQGFPEAQVLQPLRPDVLRQMTDPAYLARKRQLIDQILASYVPYHFPDTNGSDAELKQTIHKSNLALKRRYEAAGDQRPAAFWQAMDQLAFAREKYFQHPDGATDNMKQVLDGVMRKYADNSQLEEIAKRSDPKWPYLIMAHIIEEKIYFDIKEMVLITDLEAVLKGPRDSIEKQFGKLREFPAQD